MDGITISTVSEQWLEGILSVAVVLLPFLATVAGGAWLAGEAGQQVRVFWQKVRGQLEPAVNQSSDPLITLLSWATKAPPEDVVKVLLPIAKAIIKIGDDILENPPTATDLK